MNYWQTRVIIKGLPNSYSGGSSSCDQTTFILTSSSLTNISIIIKMFVLWTWFENGNFAMNAFILNGCSVRHWCACFRFQTQPNQWLLGLKSLVLSVKYFSKVYVIPDGLVPAKLKFLVCTKKTFNWILNNLCTLITVYEC